MTLGTHYEEAPNVVSEEGCRKFLSEGWRMEVVCLHSVEKRHANHFGQWGIRVISPDSGDERTLVTSRKIMEMRVFKTINGLISFLTDIGIEAPKIPMREGTRAIQQTVDEG